MSDIPEVPWRFGDRYSVVDFVQTKNVAILEEATALYSSDNDTFVKNVSEYMRDEFYYPLDNSGNPAASGQLLRHQKGLMAYHFKKCVYYMWSLPNEVLAIGAGICIDTANLGCSIFRSKGLDGAWVVLGDVISTENGTLIGRHAWVEVPFKGKIYVSEYTIHEPDINNLILAKDVYNKDSNWAQRSGIYYSAQANYNEIEFIGVGPLGVSMIWLMGLPAKRVLLFGIEATSSYKQSRLVKEWRQEENLKMKLLREAYRGI